LVPRAFVTCGHGNRSMVRSAVRGNRMRQMSWRTKPGILRAATTRDNGNGCLGRREG
jgi:hypothetical protein